MYTQDSGDEFEIVIPKFRKPITDHGGDNDDDPRGASRSVGVQAKAKAKAIASVPAGGSVVASGGASSSSGPPAAVPLPAPGGDIEMEIHGGPGGPAIPKAPAAMRGRRQGPQKKPVSAIGAGDPGTVRYEDHVKRDGTVYSNWQMICPHHRDIKCVRTLGLGPTNTRRHGPLQPLAFLHVWRDLPPGEDGHRKTDPTQAQVTAYFNEHKSELEGIWEQFDHL